MNDLLLGSILCFTLRGNCWKVAWVVIHQLWLSYIYFFNLLLEVNINLHPRRRQVVTLSAKNQTATSSSRGRRITFATIPLLANIKLVQKSYQHQCVPPLSTTIRTLAVAAVATIDKSDFFFRY